MPVTDYLAAISVGILKEGIEILDLNYEEDSEADVDMNIVMTGSGEFVEIQGTGEEATFGLNQLKMMLKLASEGLEKIIEVQKEAIGALSERIGETKK